MNIVEKTERERGFPVLVELPSINIQFNPERHFLSALVVQPPKIDENSPSWLEKLQENHTFCAFTGEGDFDKTVVEERKYFQDLLQHYRRKTFVIWLTGYRVPKKDTKFADPDRVKGLFTFRAITCPTL